MSNQSAWELFPEAKAAKSRKEEDRIWARFVEGTSPELRGFLGARRCDAIVADDILFAAYTRLYTERKSVREPRAWFYGVLRHAIARLKRQRPGREVDLDQLHEGFAERACDQDLAPIVNASASGPGPKFLNLRRALNGAIEKLPLKQRRLIRYEYFKDRPRDELPRLLGIKRNSVNQLRGRAIKSLGRLLKQGTI